MNLSFDTKDVFSIFSTQEAKAYIGQEGFIEDSFSNLQQAIEKNKTRTLLSVTDDSIYCFRYDEDGEVGCLFLPTDKVKRPGDTYRAFNSLLEFKKETNFYVGKRVSYRRKNSNDKNDALVTSICCPFENDNAYSISLTLGNICLSLDDWFKDYEWQNINGNWCVFGVKNEIFI